METDKRPNGMPTPDNFELSEVALSALDDGMVRVAIAGCRSILTCAADERREKAMFRHSRSANRWKAARSPKSSRAAIRLFAVGRHSASHGRMAR